MQVWNCTIKNDLKELIDITYTNKMHILFDSPSHMNFTIKCVLFGANIRWVTFWKKFRKMDEWRQRVRKISCWFMRTINDPERSQVMSKLIINVSKEGYYKGFWPTKIEWSVIVWSVVVRKLLKSQQWEMLHLPPRKILCLWSITLSNSLLSLLARILAMILYNQPTWR